MKVQGGRVGGPDDPMNRQNQLGKIREDSVKRLEKEELAKEKPLASGTKDHPVKIQ